MTDETLIRMLEEAAGKVPDSSAPVGDVLRRGQATVRRRRNLAAGAGVVAVLVVAGGIAVRQVPGGGPNVATGTSSAVSSSSTAGGRRLLQSNSGGVAQHTSRPQTLTNPLTTATPGRIDGVLVWSGGPAGVAPQPHAGRIHLVGTRADGTPIDAVVATDPTGHWRYDLPGGGTLTITGTSPGFGSPTGTADACTAGGPVSLRPGRSASVTVTCAVR